MELRHLIKQGRSMIPVGLDKRALVPKWIEYAQRFPTKEEIDRWLATNPPRWAMVTGFMSKIVTLDFDGETGERKMRDYGLKPHRRTPRGFHVDVQWDDNEYLSGRIDLGIDVRGDLGYVIVLGEGYEWFADYRARRSLPDALRKKMRKLEAPF